MYSTVCFSPAAAGLTQTVLYKKVYVPATGPMPADQPKFGLGKTTAREMAQIMERLAECRLSLDGGTAMAGDGAICGAILHMLRQQQDRDSLPRYLEALDTSEQGSAIANKTGALDQVRNDVALIATKNGPVVIAGFTWENADQRWTGDNEAEKTLAALGQAIVNRWSPEGLDAAAFPWATCGEADGACAPKGALNPRNAGRTKPRPAQDGVRAKLELRVTEQLFCGWHLRFSDCRGRLGDFAGLDAGGADADALRGAVDEGLDSLQIDVPAAPRDVVRVRDVVTELRAFAANVAYLCHDFAPNFFCFVLPDWARGE